MSGEPGSYLTVMMWRKVGIWMDVWQQSLSFRVHDVVIVTLRARN
jgi:hypothetical protein